MEKYISRVLFLIIVSVITSGHINAEKIVTEMMFTASFDTTEVLTMAEVMPEIKGGLQEVYKNIKYPTEAQRRNVEGRVFIKFVVDENGDVKDPQILKDIGSGCGEAAIEGIKKVKFTPGKNGGQPVSVYYTLPVTFKLQN